MENDQPQEVLLPVDAAEVDELEVELNNMPVGRRANLRHVAHWLLERGMGRRQQPEPPAYEQVAEGQPHDQDDEQGAAQVDLVAALAGALGQRRREKFPAPTYEGTGDVELFLESFDLVAEANGWNPAARLIHLRSSLKSTALDCGRGATVEAVRRALRARFGMSESQAQDALDGLRRQPKQTLHELASEVERLMGLAFPQVDAAVRETMAIDRFKSALGDASVKVHLLTRRPRTLADAMRYSDEFLQASG